MDRTNQFIRCRTKAELIVKSTFKSADVDTLFGIVEDEVYVYQGFKTMRINLEQFANGMGISLVEAQAIVNGKIDSLEEAKIIISDSINNYAAKAKDLSEEVVINAEEKIEEVTENIETEISSVKETAKEVTDEKLSEITPTQLFQRLIELEKRVRDLENQRAMSNTNEDEKHAIAENGTE